VEPTGMKNQQPQLFAVVQKKKNGRQDDTTCVSDATARLRRLHACSRQTDKSRKFANVNHQCRRVARHLETDNWLFKTD
jgi:hypothetical protein